MCLDFFLSNTQQIILIDPRLMTPLSFESITQTRDNNTTFKELKEWKVINFLLNTYTSKQKVLLNVGEDGPRWLCQINRNYLESLPLKTSRKDTNLSITKFAQKTQWGSGGFSSS